MRAKIACDPFGKWREIHTIDSSGLWELRMRDVGAIKSSPQHMLEQGIDLRFLNELKKELKAWWRGSHFRLKEKSLAEQEPSNDRRTFLRNIL